MAGHSWRKSRKRHPFLDLHWTDEQYVQLFRHLLSSGSGGGDYFMGSQDYYNVGAPDFGKIASALGTAGSAIGSAASTAWDFYNKIFPGNFDLVFGQDIYGCFGLPTGARLTSIWGSDIRFLMDPVGLFSAFSNSVPSITKLSVLGDILTGSGGGVNLTLGRDTSVLYGIKRDIHRGPTYELTSTFDDAAGLPGKVLAGLISVSVAASAILSDVFKDMTSWEHKLAEFGLGGLPDRLLALLVSWETKLALANVATEAAEAAQAKLDLAAELALQLKPDLLKAAKSDAEDAAKLAVAAADLKSNEAADRRLSIDGDFTVRAQCIELTGAPPDSKLLGLLDLSIITVNAQGAPGSENGTLILNGSKQGSLTAGPAKVQVVRTAAEGTVIVDAGAIGTVNVQQGLPDLGSRMSLKPTGVGINVGPPVGGSSIQLTDEGISISWGMAPAGASIKLTGDGIVMNYGLCTLSLTAEGITLQTAENRVAVTPAAVQTSALVIENTGQTLGGLAGMMVEINGDGQTSLQAPLMMIG